MSGKNTDLDNLLENIMSHDMMLYPIINNDIPQDEDFTLQSDIDCESLPILPLRNVVLMPGQIIPVQVNTERSKRLVHWLGKTGGYFGAITQHNTSNTPGLEDLYSVGVIAQLDAISEHGDNISIVIKGLQRFRLEQILGYKPYISGKVSLLSEVAYSDKQEASILLDNLRENFIECYRIQGRPLPKPYIERLQEVESISFIINFVLIGTNLSIEHRQQLLEIDDLRQRGIKVLAYQQAELQMLQIKATLNERAKMEMERHNKDFFLQQQMRIIQEELGTGDNELEELRKEAEGKLWSTEVAQTFSKELARAERLNPQSPDYGVQIQYLRTLLGLPWGVYTEDNFDLKKAEKTLDKDHFGLEKVKERILEHLAVLKLRGDMKSPIICLYGPPGVGKTSLGRSIAESLGRKYVRVSLGGVHDEAEIRGHRRTYIGAMCGRIIKSLQKAGSSNPVFVLDEIDKLGDSHKGDPASALLEVLDPEQNTAFHDNYLDVDYDLSHVLFIATANNIGAISQPLRDRMEIIEVSGYIAEEKHQIAKKHLISKEQKEHGLADYKLKFSPKAIDLIIEEYTRESGVRSLNKRIAEVMRKIAWEVGRGKEVPTDITPALVRSYLGSASFQRDKYQGNEHPGVVVGLAWTSVGGDILYIESSLHKGQEAKLSLTGNLGDVMKESASLALSYIKSHLADLGIVEEQIKDKSIHIHVPMGAVPKDGPSAGITIATSLVSAVTRRKVKAHIAMTGEITLRGKVLPVGGIKEKILAAKRSGIKEIIMCRENEKDVLEIKESYRKGLTFHYVEHIKEVLAIALTNEIA